jgi:hypothetical protein
VVAFPSLLPVQSSLPGTLAALTLLLVPTGFLAVAVWVYDDARDRGSARPTLWGVATGTLPFVLPAYLVLVGLGRLGPRVSPPATRERAAGTYGFGALLAFSVASTFAPPDPVTQLLSVAVALVPALAVAYVLTGRVGPAPDSYSAG